MRVAASGHGLPGSGKSTLAAQLGAALGGLVLSKDTVKEALADAAGPAVDGRVLGGVTMDVIWALSRAAADTVVVDSFWHRTRDIEFAGAGLQTVGADHAVEVRCQVPPEVARARYIRRRRHDVHADGQHLATDWADWATDATPLGLCPVLPVDTTRPVDLPDLSQRLTGFGISGFDHGEGGRDLDVEDNDDDLARLWASLPRKRVGAGVIILDPDGRVLLVNPTYKLGWEGPGGLVEAGESPRSAASREILEELGIDLEIGPMLLCDWAAPGHRPDDGVMFLYQGGQIDEQAIRLASGELSEWRWCAKQDVRELLHPAKARRVNAAIDARLGGAFTELEDGYRVVSASWGRRRSH